jgi:hypothetical protein
MLTGADLRFGYEGFERMIDAILAARYGFARFDRAPPAISRICRLRFDVDISPASTLVLGDILQRRSLPATFLFQLNCETYCIFASRILDTIDELRRQGHAVGLHIDSAVFGADEERIAMTIEWFSTCCRRIDNVVSFHRPDMTVLGRRYAKFQNTYAAEFFDVERYLSDSRKSLEFINPLRQWLDEGRTPLQVLLHPEWWESDAEAETVWNTLRARRLAELEDYVTVNFRKVFAPILQDR